MTSLPIKFDNADLVDFNIKSYFDSIEIEIRDWVGGKEHKFQFHNIIFATISNDPDDELPFFVGEFYIKQINSQTLEEQLLTLKCQMTYSNLEGDSFYHTHIEGGIVIDIFSKKFSIVD